MKTSVFYETLLLMPRALVLPDNENFKIHDSKIFLIYSDSPFLRIV